MHHPIPAPPNGPSANNGTTPEIQPHQHVIGRSGPIPACPAGPESVDAAWRALYKERQWRRAQSRRRCSLDSAAIGIFSPEQGILKNTQLETQQQITQFERPARSSPTNRAITAEG
jgi:hypothetical protein